MKRTAKVILTLALSLMLTIGIALNVTAEYSKFSNLFMDSFDTVIQIIAYAPDQETFDQWFDAAHNSYLYMHKLFDAYNSYEDEGIISVYTLNQRAAEAPVQVDPLLFGLLTFSKSNYTLCQGQANIAMGSVLSIWHTYREEALDNPANAKLPPMEELVAANDHVNIDDLVLDAENMTVYFADPALRLDVGAVAKGYATEVVAQMFAAGGLPSYCISAGGNVRTGDKPMDGRLRWGIGIQSPDGEKFNLDGTGIEETIFATDLSVVTSGDYQRYYEVDGVRFAHLIDPDTLMPPHDFRSVSIITKDSGYADMLSTTAFLMPYEESRAFIESLDNVEAIWLFTDGTHEYTDGAKAYCKRFGATNK